MSSLSQAASCAARRTRVPHDWPRQSCPLRPCVKASAARAPLAAAFRRRARGRARRLAPDGNPDGPLVVALGGISAGRAVADVGTARTAGGAKWSARAWRSTRSAFACWASTTSAAAAATTGPRAGQTNFPIDQRLRPGRGSAAPRQSSGRRAARRDRRRVVRRHGRAGVRRALSRSSCASSSISAADRAHPMATAWRSVQRASSVTQRRTATRRKACGSRARWPWRRIAAPRSSRRVSAVHRARIDGRFQFPVEEYLFARGDAYAATYVPEAFVCLSESIDLHTVDAARILVPVTLVAVREDQLVPLADMRALRRASAVRHRCTRSRRCTATMPS